jgi:peroxiredoxin
MHLRVGDTFECRVTRINDDAIEFHTADLVPRRVAHDRVKAVEFGVLYRRSALADAKWQRLLTLPRLRKNDPPTHILAGVNNDFLRGRLVSLSDDAVRFDVGDSERAIPRDRIAAIIWLQPDATARVEEAADADADPAADPVAELSADSPEPSGGPSAIADRGDVQVISTTGMSLTFAAQEVDEESIAGTSAVLGACRLPLKEVAELLMGDRRREWSVQLGYHRWKLADAPLPRAFLPDAEGKEGAGLDSALVGQPAPDFQLELAGGGKFRLADERGHVVVLDFWATWCAPCIAGLPRVARTVGEFEGVKLVAVNLQQTAAESTEALTRLELDITVALDRDGRVAAQYGASAIPYTVVIGPDGQVARVFIGTTAKSEDELRAVIKELQTPAS